MRTIFQYVLTAATASLLAACASTTAPSAGASLPGVYAANGLVVTLHADGRSSGEQHGKPWVSGRYTHTADTLEIVDDWYADMQAQGMCVGVKGRYQWRIADGALHLNPIEDACEGRRKALIATPTWEKRS